MRIDPRYFNIFMVMVAVVAAILIVITTMSYISGREAKFQQQMMEVDSLAYTQFPYMGRNDSLQLTQFEGRYLLLDFWSTWSDPAIASHKELMNMPTRYLDTLSVIAASVRIDSGEALSYKRRYNYPFIFVDGTDFFHRMNLPGVPSQVLFNPKGEVIATFVGYTDSTRYDSLKTLIQDE
ncbi:MAG: TlpA disulfide reductase family protein [Balneolaceae bacterium]|nr:TlpA disulfide reductase family protein [Balneolaceae bacterium]